MHGFLLRSKTRTGTPRVVYEAFHDCEAEFIQIAGREGLRDGTTAVCLVQDESLTVAHVGDSRGVLCREGGKALAITQDHKPELEAEKRRIEALGGFVSYIGCWRKRNPPQPPLHLERKAASSVLHSTVQGVLRAHVFAFVALYAVPLLCPPSLPYLSCAAC